MKTDTELLDWLEKLVDCKHIGCATASVKLASKHTSVYRLGDGPWKPTLREAIAAHAERWKG